MMTLLAIRQRRVERKVQLEHVDARTAEKTKRRRLDVGTHEVADAMLRYVRALPNASHLQFGAFTGMCGSRPAPLAVTISDGTPVAATPSRATTAVEPFAHGLEWSGFDGP
jgi:hypothetical protein